MSVNRRLLNLISFASRYVPTNCHSCHLITYIARKFTQSNSVCISLHLNLVEHADGESKFNLFIVKENGFLHEWPSATKNIFGQCQENKQRIKVQKKTYLTNKL